jgi:hypothetical protein
VVERSLVRKLIHVDSIDRASSPGSAAALPNAFVQEGVAMLSAVLCNRHHNDLIGRKTTDRPNRQAEEAANQSSPPPEIARP